MMRVEGGPVSRAIARRRSLRSFASREVEVETIRHLVTLACTAPAPHHSQPWRFVHVTSADARVRLSDAMTDNWRSDLEREGRSVHDIAKLLRRSQQRISDAPALLLACLILADARPWSDRSRQVAERDMFIQSLGAALQNILLAASESGLVGYLKGAPLFCAEAIKDALELPSDWEPTFLVLLGYPEEGAAPSAGRNATIGDFLIER